MSCLLHDPVETGGMISIGEQRKVAFALVLMMPFLTFSLPHSSYRTMTGHGMSLQKDCITLSIAIEHEHYRQ